MTAPQEMTKEQIEQVYRLYEKDGVLLLVKLRALCDLALASLSADRVSVPREPTEEMLAPGEALIQGVIETCYTKEIDGFAAAKHIYKAMLSAAPQPNAVPQDAAGLPRNAAVLDSGSSAAVPSDGTQPSGPAGTAPAPASGGETPKEPSVLANIFEWQNYAKALQRELAAANAAREGAMEEAARICRDYAKKKNDWEASAITALELERAIRSAARKEKP